MNTEVVLIIITVVLAINVLVLRHEVDSMEDRYNHILNIIESQQKLNKLFNQNMNELNDIIKDKKE